SRNSVEDTGTPPGGAIGITFPNGAGLNSSGVYNGNFAGFKTQLKSIVPNGLKSSISTPAYASDNGDYIYFSGPANTNASSAIALYTRHFRARKATQGGTAVTFANTFFPPASAATTDAAFKNPVRLDRGELDSDAGKVVFSVFQKGHQAVVVFSQDNHLWGTVTS